MKSIIITVLVISLISFVLALLLTLADKYIADYGEVTLKINDKDPITVPGGNRLLSTLRDQKVFIPSACGGKGSCGYCKVKVLKGGGPVLATEKPWLSNEEMESHTRLSCQLKVKENIEIEIPEELFNVKEYDTKVVNIEDVTDRIKKITFELPEGEEIKFKPGQYMQLKAPEYEGNDEEVYRAYSIASSAKDKRHIELLIGFTGGIATTYVHKFLKVGDTVNLNGPYGDFYYKDDDGEKIVFVATGTGFAPIRSILYHMKDNDIKREAVFIFGSKTTKDLFLLDELKMFEDSLNFKFMPVLSRVTDEMNWKGDTGHVDDSIRKHLINGEKYACYLCGSPRVIDSTVAALKEKGVSEDKIFYDKFE